jgi:hypothetical protein
VKLNRKRNYVEVSKMAETALDVIRQHVEEQGEVPVELSLGYRVLNSPINGNLPINDSVTGEICGMPVKLSLKYTLVPGPDASYPVNTELQGTIGETPVKARLPYTIVFGSIAGNIPVNTGVEWRMNGEKVSLKTPFSLISAFARGGGMGGGSGGTQTGLKMEVVYKQGVPVEVEAGGGGGPVSESGRPIPQKLHGRIGDLDVDCRFGFTYYINASSGRNPVNNRLYGVIRKV